MYVHGDNLRQKENHKTKYLDNDSKKYLVEIRENYDKWKIANEKLQGPFVETGEEATKKFFQQE